MDMGESELVEILTVESIGEKLAAHRRGERGPVRVLVIPKYAPHGTVGWVYEVEKVNRSTVSATPLGGGRRAALQPITLVEADDRDVEAYELAHAGAGGTRDGGATACAGTVVTLAGEGWKQPADALWVVLGLKGMTDVSVARLGGEGGRTWPKVPRSYITAVIGGDVIVEALEFLRSAQ